MQYGKMNPEVIGKRLTILRGGLSREKVAADCRISVSAVTMYENGMRIPRDEVKLRLANYFGASVEEIFFNSDVTICDKKPYAE